jgi:hypothetical protein
MYSIKKLFAYISERKPLRYTLGILIGGSLGFLYYFFIGCNTGTCPLTSNPYNSVMIGSVMGLVWVFSPGKSDKEQ